MISVVDSVGYIIITTPTIENIFEAVVIVVATEIPGAYYCCWIFQIKRSAFEVPASSKAPVFEAPAVQLTVSR